MCVHTAVLNLVLNLVSSMYLNLECSTKFRIFHALACDRSHARICMVDSWPAGLGFFCGHAGQKLANDSNDDDAIDLRYWADTYGRVSVRRQGG